MGHISWPLCHSWLNCIKTYFPRWVMLKSAINSFSIVMRYIVSNNVVRYIWNSGLGSYIRNLCMFFYFGFFLNLFWQNVCNFKKNYFKRVKNPQNAFYAKQYNSRRKRFYNNIKPESKSSRSRLHKYLNHFSSIFDSWGREFFCWKISLHLELLIFMLTAECVTGQLYPFLRSCR